MKIYKGIQIMKIETQGRKPLYRIVMGDGTTRGPFLKYRAACAEIDIWKHNWQMTGQLRGIYE